jgi:hypothetical protein
VFLERFDYETYGQLVSRMRATHANLVFGDVASANTARPFFLLRHDVDFSPEAALAMAQLERRLGVRATYFLLVSSAVYNIHAAEHCDVPARLVELGHEVGLHYDVEVYERGRDFRSAYEGERAALAALSGQPINAIAPHNPSVRGSDPLVGARDVTHSYAIVEKLDMAYVSDSCGAWRDDTIAVLTQPELPLRLQMLIHPIFWADQSADRWERLDSLVNGLHLTTEAWARHVRKCWAEHEAVQEHERRHRRMPEEQRRP